MKLFFTILPFRLLLTQQSLAADFNFGQHVTDRCENPIATVGNSKTLTRIPPRDANGNCNNDAGYCIGDCVTVIIRADGNIKSDPINIIAGNDLPDPGTCSDIAMHTNRPVGSAWDFTHTGMCGKGEKGSNYWQNCLVHDFCVWARCQDDELNAGGVGSGKDDEFCGMAFRHARKDFSVSKTIDCVVDKDCPSPLVCSLLKCKPKLEEGDYCDDDTDCNGYCQLLRCRIGDEGDRCGKDSDCKDDLTCYGFATGRRCTRKKGKGAKCGSDADCLGYCELLRCWNGDEGDRCGNDSDCKNGMTCYGFATGKKCTRKKREGASCGSDADCLGYCQMLRCWNGSRGDKCKHTSDCQPGLKCKKRCRFCAQRICK